MSDEDNGEWTDGADEREQVVASILVGLFDEKDLKSLAEKMPFADAEELFTELHRATVDKILSLTEESRAEFLSDLLTELNWNYVVSDLLNEAAEAGFYKEGETKLLKDEAKA